MKTSILALAVGLVLALTGCVPGDGTPTPTPLSSGSASSTPSAPDGSPTPSEMGGAAEPVTAAIVVVTASTLSVFGTDGTTLLATDYVADAAGVAAQLTEVLGTTPRVSTQDALSDACPSRTLYDFGGMVLGTPGALGSPATVGLPGTYDVVVTTAAIGGIPVETVGGQHVGATRAAFEAAVGDEALLDEYGSTSYFGFDIVDPAADPYDQVGTHAFFDGGVLTSLITPSVVRFVGGCD